MNTTTTQPKASPKIIMCRGEGVAVSRILRKLGHDCPTSLAAQIDARLIGVDVGDTDTTYTHHLLPGRWYVVTAAYGG